MHFQIRNLIALSLLIFSATAVTQHSFAQESAPKELAFIVVSDIDDTIKQTDVGNPIVMFFKGLFGKQPFAGMPELYRAFKENSLKQSFKNEERMFYLSESPDFLTRKAVRFLKKGGFPKGDVILRPWTQMFQGHTFKLPQLQKISAVTTLPFILIGDDTQADPETYAELQKSQPDRVAAIYIHRVDARKIPEGQKAFVTAFDIALAEVNAGRLSVEQALQIGQRLLDVKEFEDIIPSYMTCPDGRSSEVPATLPLAIMNDEIFARILGSCHYDTESVPPTVNPDSNP